VVVIAATGDRLFSLAYTRQVFARIDAPSKSLVVVDSEHHLLFVDDLDVAVPEVLRLLGALAPDRDDGRPLLSSAARATARR
jgi:hypothetical protein